MSSEGQAPQPAQEVQEVQPAQPVQEVQPAQPVAANQDNQNQDNNFNITPERLAIISNPAVIHEVEVILRCSKANIDVNATQLTRLAPYLGFPYRRDKKGNKTSQILVGQARPKLAHVVSNLPYIFDTDGEKLTNNLLYLIHHSPQLVVDAIVAEPARGTNPYGNPAEIPEPLQVITDN